MKKLKKTIIIITFLVIALAVLASQAVFSKDNSNGIKKAEYTENYKKWLELSEEEKKNYIIPRMYEVPYTKVENKNPLLKARMLRSNLSSKYSLQDIIGNNLTIRNQQETNSCWAFASLSSLETNLALRNYYNNITTNIYDFSERHMEYSTSRVFLNDEINQKGYNRKVGDRGKLELSVIIFN